jgi:response regulator RpfG family c-di-GMP phosphodiesterase
MGIPRRSITDWIKKNFIPTLRIGKENLIYESDVSAFIKIKDIINYRKKIPMVLTEPDKVMRSHYYDILKKDFDVYPLILNEHYIDQLKKARPLFLVMDIDWIHFEAIDIVRQIKATPELDHMAIFITTKMYSEDNAVKFLDIGVEQFLPKETGDKELIVRIKSWLMFRYGFNSL